MYSLIGNNRKPDITFHSNGRIDISARVARLLSIQRGNALDIISDGEEYYLYVRSHSEAGHYEATVFPSQHGSRHYLAWSRKLARAVIDACGLHVKKVRLTVGQPVPVGHINKALPIITRNPI